MAAVETLAIIGSGTMGHSIALSAAMAGLQINVWGSDEADLERGRKGFAEKLDVLQRHGVVTAKECGSVAAAVTFTASLADCIAQASFIIEAIPENIALKQEWFAKLDAICDPSVILASNTSGLSPTAIAQNTRHPERTLVTHFWNPGHLIPLVEIVKGERTGDEAVQRAVALLTAINKKPIILQKDILGSIGNRMQYALFREAQHILAQGVATVEDIDAAVKYSIGRRLPVTGPFMTADMGGLDVFDAISCYLFPDLSISQASLASMRELVDRGSYGQKNGAGFYEWTPEFSRQMNEQRESELIAWLKKDLQSSQSQ